MTSILAILLLAATFSTSTAHPSHSASSKLCTSHTLTVHPSTTNYVWAKPFISNYDVVDFLSNIASRTAATDFNPYSGGQISSTTYSISATFCTPKKGAYSNGNVLLASHGLNFDGRQVMWRAKSVLWS
jgi:hypothetical protein